MVDDTGEHVGLDHAAAGPAGSFPPSRGQTCDNLTREKPPTTAAALNAFCWCPLLPWFTRSDPSSRIIAATGERREAVFTEHYSLIHL
jgi:hypothetical protein